MKRTPSDISLKDHETRVGEVLVKKGIAFRDAEQTFKGGITRWMWRAHFVVDEGTTDLTDDPVPRRSWVPGSPRSEGGGRQ